MKKEIFRKIAVITLTFCLMLAVSWSMVFAGQADTVQVGLIADPETLNPLEWRSQNDLAIMMSTHDALLWGVNKETKMINLDLAYRFINN